MKKNLSNYLLGRDRGNFSKSVRKGKHTRIKDFDLIRP
jgi:hypothetical protein